MKEPFIAREHKRQQPVPEVTTPHWHCVECDGSRVWRDRDQNVYCSRCWSHTWKLNEALECARAGCSGTWLGIGKDT